MRFGDRFQTVRRRLPRLAVIQFVVRSAEDRTGDEADRRFTARRAAAIVKAAALNFGFRQNRRGESGGDGEGEPRVSLAQSPDVFLPLFERSFSSELVRRREIRLVNDRVFRRADGFVGENVIVFVPAELRRADDRRVRLRKIDVAFKFFDMAAARAENQAERNQILSEFDAVADQQFARQRPRFDSAFGVRPAQPFTVIFARPGLRFGENLQRRTDQKSFAAVADVIHTPFIAALDEFKSTDGVFRFGDFAVGGFFYRFRKCFRNSRHSASVVRDFSRNGFSSPGCLKIFSAEISPPR